MAKNRNLDSRLKVMRKRRGRSLHRKIVEYAGLFNLDITIVARDKINGEYEIFQPTRDINFPPAMRDIEPTILHTGRKGNVNTDFVRFHQRELIRMEKLVRRSKVPKPPSSG
ncbi:hypothetical protein F4813DRAFT_160522 [Daldinia decipiens]|uniref:uncharacterized protein n=1 Tax=Daldinia decipiens TaxID=326647 RepID=UPI0020C4BAA8|nr:uncharacterized protein F4813DRAFT_160522 [Daldinia decipiens]KAI1655477.1 hypothetical protein F4813DRAFT_160522 [Daldinia decipiens]